ncbi:MAG: acyl-CoA synthetase [Myxococcales bacterium]|nr:acyl-CoA synthetase [Myxococcales bacterium]
MRLHLAGSPDGTEFMVICQDRYYQVVGMLAVWQLGKPVTLPASAHSHTLNMAAESDSLLMVHDTDIRGGARVQTVLANASFVDGPLKPIPPEQVLVKLCTSGSTGTPVVHPKTARQLFGEADLHVRWFSLQGGQALISTVPTHHIFGLLWGIVVPIRAGIRIERSTPLFATTLAERVKATRPHVLVTTPVHLEHCSMVGGAELKPLRHVFCSGGPLTSSVAKRFSEHFQLTVTEVLGSTETGGIAWRLRRGDEPAEPLWQPLPAVVVGADADGRLLLESPFVSTDSERPMRCADRILPMHDGHFQYLGRSDDIVKIGGKRFSRFDLEQKIRTITGVTDVGILVRDSTAARGHVLEAAIVTSGLTATDLKKALGDCIDSVAVPRRITIVSELPRDATGKLPVASLRQILGHE